jgi:hypothetical protein
VGESCQSRKKFLCFLAVLVLLGGGHSIAHEIGHAICGWWYESRLRVSELVGVSAYPSVTAPRISRMFGTAVLSSKRLTITCGAGSLSARGSAAARVRSASSARSTSSRTGDFDFEVETARQVAAVVADRIRPQRAVRHVFADAVRFGEARREEADFDDAMQEQARHPFAPRSLMKPLKLLQSLCRTRISPDSSGRLLRNNSILDFIEYSFFKISV